MELKLYLGILVKQWRIVLLTAVLVFSTAALASMFIPPSYKATTTLRVITPVGGSLDSPYYQIGYIDRLLNTYVQIAGTEQVENLLKEKLDLATLPDITVAIIPNSEIIRIIVKSKDPNLAALTANTLADVLISLEKEADHNDSNELNALETRKQEYESKLAQAQSEHGRLVQAYSEAAAEAAILDREIQSKDISYQNLMTQYEQALVTVAMSPSGTSPHLTKDALARELDRIQNEKDTLNMQYKKLLIDSNTYSQQITLVEGSIVNIQNAYSDLLNRIDTVSTANQRQADTENIIVISPASKPSEPSGPGRLLVLVVELILGIIFGIAAAFVWENLDSSADLETPLKPATSKMIKSKQNI